MPVQEPYTEGGELPDLEELYDEFQYYTDVLLGRVDCPIQSPYLALAEVATAYYARGLEVDAVIHRAEAAGDVQPRTPYYRFRTGALRSFIDSAKRMSDLGSRRLTQEDLLTRQRRDSGERF